MVTNLRNNICYLRRRDGLTQVEMAKILGICVATYRKIEKMEPTVRLHGQIILRVSRYFHYSVDDLILLDLSREVH